MKTPWKTAALAALLLVGGNTAAPQEATNSAEAANGRWDAVLTRNGMDFLGLDIKGSGPTLEGVFYDGWTTYDVSTSATFKNGELQLELDYLVTINAKLTGGAFVQNGATGAQHAFSARVTFRRPQPSTSRLHLSPVPM